jgi:hypothetical protein
MIPKSGNRFSEKIMLHKKLERDGDSKKSYPVLVAVSHACIPSAGPAIELDRMECRRDPRNMLRRA